MVQGMKALLARRRSDRGESLIEILITVVLLGIVATAAVISITGMIGLAHNYRTTVSLSEAVSNAANEVHAAIDSHANGHTPLYAVCATPDTYGSKGTNAIPLSDIPTGYTASITKVEYWNGSSFQTACVPPPQHIIPTSATVPGEQLVTVTAVDTTTHQSMSLDIVVTNPFGPLTPISAPGAAQLVFLTQPQNTAYNAIIPPFAVAVEDASGNILTNDYTSLSIAITPGTGNPGGYLEPGCVGTEFGGVFTFNGCQIPIVGTNYTFTVTDSASNLTAVSAPFTIEPGPPTQPLNVNATPVLGIPYGGAPAAVLTWGTPAYDGQSPITGYNAVSSPLGGTCATPYATNDCQIASGLSAGGSYTFGVTATNAVGTGPSGISNTIVVGTVPDVANNLSAPIYPEKAVPTWSPGNNGGSAITSYTTSITGTGYLCNPPDVLDPATGICTHQAVSSYAASVSYSCPRGGTLSGSNCVTSTSSSYAATVHYYCNSGDTLSGTTCTHETTTTYSASSRQVCPNGATSSTLGCYFSTSGIKNLTDYQCPFGSTSSGGGLTGPNQDPTLQCWFPSSAGSPSQCSTVTVPGAYGPPNQGTTGAGGFIASQANTFPLPGSWNPAYAATFNGADCSAGYAALRTFTCPSGYQPSFNAVTLPGNPSIGLYGDYQNQPATNTECVKFTSSTTQYLCNSGDTLAGQTCYHYAYPTYAALTNYYCASGGTLSGTTCTITSGSQYAATPTYSCPSGGTLNLTQCDSTTTTNYSATTFAAPSTSCTSLSTSCATGQVPPGSYTYTVNESNVFGTSLNTSSTLVVGDGTPFAPTGLTATSGPGGSAVLSWTAPVNDGGSPIGGYTVTASNGASCTKPTTSCTITGLTVGQTYTFTVYASNAYGPGLVSAPTSLLVAGPPGTPTGVSVSPFSGGSATVTWTSGVGTGSTPATSYTIYYYDNGNTASTYSTVVNVTGDQPGVSQYSDPIGVSQGGTWSFYVVANNSTLGSSGPSATVSATLTAPSAPQNLQALSYQNGRVQLTWSAPASDGGATIASNGYTVVYQNSSGTQYTAPGVSSGVEIGNLASPAGWKFWVYATNGVGLVGPYSSPQSASTGGPTSMNAAVSASGVVTLSWAPPTNYGGQAPTGYSINESLDGGNTWTNIINNQPYTSAQVQIQPSQAGDNIQFLIDTVTPNGWGDWNAFTMPKTPTAPQAFSVTENSYNSVNLSWAPPAYDGDSALSGYFLRACDQTTGAPCAYAGLGTWQASGQPQWYGATPWGTFPPGDNIQYSVVAANGYEAIGSSGGTGFNAANSDGSGVSNVNFTLPPVSAPSAPTITYTSGFVNGAVQINWTSPTSNGNAPITSYSIAYYDTLNGVVGPTYTTTMSVSNDVPGQSTYSDTIGVGPPGTWSFYVYGTNAAGLNGAEGITTQVYYPLNPVNNFYVNVDNTNAVFFNWTPPNYSGNSSAITYFLRVCDLTSGPPCAYAGPGAWDGNPASIPWGNWVLGHNFQFSVVGTTGGASTFNQAVAQGNGVANFTMAMPPSGDPSQPLTGPEPGGVVGVNAYSAGAGSHAVNLYWYAPTWLAGSSLRGYYVSECNLTAGGCYADPNGIPSSGGYASMQFGGLTSGDTYEFSVVALLNGGPTASATSFAAATSTDGAPTAVGYAVAG